jgi:LuxR family transcriptional regulator, maltose regulon positive regulatory protein
MPDHLVTTKLLVPRPRARAVARRRLDELLGRGSDATLTLVSAPAGFGKTTMLAAWLVSRDPGRSAAWVSLDERDRDPSSFWIYVLLAVDRAAPGTATAALAQLESGQAPIDVVLTALLNELSVRSEDITLVLDDYHLAEGPDIGPGMVFLLDHLPPQVHVVISTRADPALPLARLRARGELVEVRAADLRFTGDEATTYLNDSNSLGLSPADVATLERRTEGWAAALQLAALSLRGRDDTSQFIAGFAGDDRFVVDYLVDEVLDRQLPDVRQFLLETSTLDRLTAGLCDAVTGRTDGRAMLESLERQNLFVIPLDDHRRWYRYHHLFADVLHSRLLDERPGYELELHRRASDWYDQAGDPEASVRHALAAGDVELAAARAELAIPGLHRERREAVTRRWIDELPADIVRNRPVLAIGFIGALSRHNEFDGLPQRLRDVEELLAGPADDLVVLDDAELLRIPAAVETYRAALALVSGDLAGTVEHADHALARAPEADDLTSASASALVGLASWANGDLAEAHRAYRLAAEGLTRAGHIADVLGCTIALTDIELTQGRLNQALQSCEQALDLAAHQSPQPRGVADMYVVLSRVALERGDLPGAGDYLRRADELGETGGLPQNPYRWRVAMALLRQAEGRASAAVDLLEEAERVYVGDFSPNVQPVAATRARVLAAAGEVPEALAWARRRGLSATDDLTYAREYEHLSLAHVLYADHVASASATSLADAAALLDRLVSAAEDGGRLGVVIEGLVLQALVRQAAGERERALDALERALRLAEPPGCVRAFTVHAAPMTDLLKAVLGRHHQMNFVTQVLAMASPHATAGAPASSQPSPAMGSRGGPAGGALIEPLSRRELVVLGYLGTDLDGPAIARELGVSLSTIRTHTQHIYAKLGVTNRRAAVRRAHQLNLSARTPSH